MIYKIFMKKINDIKFFKTDAVTLAKNLIGKWIEQTLMK